MPLCLPPPPSRGPSEVVVASRAVAVSLHAGLVSPMLYSPRQGSTLCLSFPIKKVGSWGALSGAAASVPGSVAVMVVRSVAIQWWHLLFCFRVRRVGQRPHRGPPRALLQEVAVCWAGSRCPMALFPAGFLMNQFVSSSHCGSGNYLGNGGPHPLPSVRCGAVRGVTFLPRASHSELIGARAWPPKTGRLIKAHLSPPHLRPLSPVTMWVTVWLQG